LLLIAPKGIEMPASDYTQLVLLIF